MAETWRMRNDPVVLLRRAAMVQTHGLNCPHCKKSFEDIQDFLERQAAERGSKTLDTSG